MLDEYATDTWTSFEAMAVPETGLPADNIGGDLSAGSRSGFTSPTNIGAYLWSTVAARDIGLIDADEARERMTTTLESVAQLEKHEPSGQFYNWYDPVTLEKLRIWPENGSVVKPFLSSVDNGWLATGLLLTARAEPSLADEADAIREDMDFGCYYNPAENQIRGGFWDEDPNDAAAVTGDYCGMGQDVWFTGHHYGAFNTEPRIASYLGIAEGQIPARHYYGTYRTFPATCDWAWTETKPVGEWKTYNGVRVFEGALPYRGMKLVPSWGGSMFEALMVPLFVPEETWGPKSWGRNHPLYVRAQIEHGLADAKYGYWGFSPSNNPEGGYREYGVDAHRPRRAGLHLRRQAHEVGPVVRRLRPPGHCRPDRRPVRRRRGHAARVVPRAPLRAGPGAREPREAPRRLRLLRAGWLLRRGGRQERHRLAALPRARPGHGHGRARQRARR